MATEWIEQAPAKWLQEMVTRQSWSQAEPQDHEAAIILRDTYLTIHATVVWTDRPLRPLRVWSHAALEEVWRWYTTLTCYLFPACPSHVVTHCLGINRIPVNPVPVFFNLFLSPPQQQRKARVFKSLITCGALGWEIIAYLWQQPPSLMWFEQQCV